jgi:hypothetical protein
MATDNILLYYTLTFQKISNKFSDAKNSIPILTYTWHMAKQLDSTGSHTANWTWNWLWLCGWQVTDDPPCSSHLMPSELYLLDPIQSTWLADHLQETSTSRCWWLTTCRTGVYHHVSHMKESQNNSTGNRLFVTLCFSKSFLIKTTVQLPNLILSHWFI